MDWDNKTRNKIDFEIEFNKQKLRYECTKVTEEHNFTKFNQQLVFNELNEIKEFYLLLNPKFESKPIYDYSNLSKRSCVEFDEGKDYNINPSFIKKFNHYKTFKYVLSCLIKNKNFHNDNILYDKPNLPIIDKPEPIDLDKIKSVRPNRFPCNFEKVYNESEFSKYLQVHYHKIKNRHNLNHINSLNKETLVHFHERITAGYFDKQELIFIEEKFI